jgi:hypothetical protein
MSNPKSAGSAEAACMFAQRVKPDARAPMPKIRFVTPVCRWTPLVSMFTVKRHAGCTMPDGAGHVSGLKRKNRKNRNLFRNKIMNSIKLRDFHSFLIKSKESTRRLS